MTVDDVVRYRKLPPLLARLVEADKLRDTPALRHCREVISAKPRVTALCVLSGSTGTGKTVASAWALSQDSVGSGLWLTAPMLCKVPREGEKDPMGRACDVELLVLDDLGTEHGTSGWSASRVSELLEHRELYRLKTLVSTNLTAGEVVGRYGPRLLSRIEGDPIGWRECGTVDLRARPS
jgi:DNA replication protein DnaC